MVTTLVISTDAKLLINLESRLSSKNASKVDGKINVKLQSIKVVNFGGTKHVFDISFRLKIAVIT